MNNSSVSLSSSRSNTPLSGSLGPKGYSKAEPQAMYSNLQVSGGRGQDGRIYSNLIMAQGREGALYSNLPHHDSLYANGGNFLNLFFVYVYKYEHVAFNIISKKNCMLCIIS